MKKKAKLYIAATKFINFEYNSYLGKIQNVFTLEARSWQGLLASQLCPWQLETKGPLIRIKACYLFLKWPKPLAVKKLNYWTWKANVQPKNTTQPKTYWHVYNLQFKFSNVLQHALHVRLNAIIWLACYVILISAGYLNVPHYHRRLLNGCKIDIYNYAIWKLTCMFWSKKVQESKQNWLCSRVARSFTRRVQPPKSSRPRNDPHFSSCGPRNDPQEIRGW